MLRPLVLRVIVIRWVQEEQPEGPVRYGRGEQVRGQGVVDPLLRLLRPVPVQLDAVGLDGDGVGPVQALRQLRQRLPGPAAGVEDAQRVPAPVVGAGGGVNQLRDQVDDPGRRRVEPAFCLCSESHVDSPFVSCLVLCAASGGDCHVFAFDDQPHHLADAHVALVAQHLVGVQALRARDAEGGDELGVAGDDHPPHQHGAALGQSVAVELDRGVPLLRFRGGPVEMGLSRLAQVL